VAGGHQFDTKGLASIVEEKGEPEARADSTKKKTSSIAVVPAFVRSFSGMLAWAGGHLPRDAALLFDLHRLHMLRQEFDHILLVALLIIS
jgi:hypothetical protein